jgi:hypothetical protein
MPDQPDQELAQTLDEVARLRAALGVCELALTSTGIVRDDVPPDYDPLLHAAQRAAAAPDTDWGPEVPLLEDLRLRAGRHAPTVLRLQLGPEPDDADPVVGMATSPAWTEAICAAVNTRASEEPRPGQQEEAASDG